MYFVYAIYNSQSDKIYIGFTQNIEERLKRHNGDLKCKQKSFTYKNKGGSIWKLVYLEELLTRTEAVKREKQLKSFQGRKFIRGTIYKDE
jgi:putative endonuclease